MIVIGVMGNSLRERLLRMDNLTTIGRTVEDIQDYLTIDLEKVHQWLLANKLTLNKDKTEYMIISSRQRLKNIATDPIVNL